MAYTLTTALKSDAAGQTLSAQLKDTTGANVGTAVTTGFVDLGAGFYSWTYAAFPDGFQGTVTFSAAGAVKAVAAVNPQEGENLDVKVSSRAAVLVGSAITYIGPIALSGDVTIVHGDDYNATDGRALEWTTADPSTWPDLTGATVKLTIKSTSSQSILTKTGTVVTATGTNKKVRIEPTAADTGTLSPGIPHGFDVQATLASGRVITLVRGNATVLPDYTP